jgi:sulfur carrier protein ThiS
MQITLKLYASLGDYLPAGQRRGNELPLELPAGTTVMDAIAPYGLPPKLVHLVLINGAFVPPEQRAARTLAEGDVLAIWPPIAGG